MGMDKQIGSLEPGKRADLIVVGMSAARQTPMYDPVSHLVYVTRGDDVQTTIVNGKLLMRDRKVLTLDEDAILREARQWSEKVRAAVTPQKKATDETTEPRCGNGVLAVLTAALPDGWCSERPTEGSAAAGGRLHPHVRRRFLQRGRRGVLQAGDHVSASQAPAEVGLMLVKYPGADGWLVFRDTFEVDGKSVRGPNRNG